MFPNPHELAFFPNYTQCVMLYKENTYSIDDYMSHISILRSFNNSYYLGMVDR